jgi:hypothetical protein
MKMSNPVTVQDQPKEAHRNKHYQLIVVVNNIKSEEHPSVKDKKHLIYDRPIFKAKRYDPY